MKKIYILPSLAIASMGFLAFQQGNSGNGIVQEFMKEHRFIKNAGMQSGLTGAPGEANCTQCHAGTTQAGANENNVLFLNGAMPVTTYEPGSSYTISLQMASNPVKKGFSAVALDGTNTNAGSFIGSGTGGTQNFTTAGRQYVSHTSTSNTNATPVWIWTWVAPASNVGPVTFYLASNAANGNNNASGDVIYLSTHVITHEPGAGIEESEVTSSFEAGYSAANNKVTMNFASLAAGDMFFNLVDLNGRSVFTYEMGLSEIGDNSESVVLPSDIKDGMYIVHFFVGNTGMSANILVKK